MNELLNIGDIIFQLFAFLIPIFFIGMIVFFVLSAKKQKDQLNRIEEKLDRISGEISKKEGIKRNSSQ